MFMMKVFFLISAALATRSFLLPMTAMLSVFGGIAAAREDGTDLPSVILVPGAFHQPIVYNDVVKLLRDHKYKHLYKIDLPSVGAVVGRDKDIAEVRGILNEELAAGRDVLLVGNSYGGTVIGEAVKGLENLQAKSLFRRRPHASGKILGLVFFAGFLPYINDVLHPETKPDIRDISPSFFRFTDDGKVYPDGDPELPPEKTFYNALPQKEAEKWAKKLQFSSFEALAANATYIPYTGGFTCYYVIGGQDVSVSPALAQTYIDQEGAQFKVERLPDADHIPMLSQPEGVVRIIRKAAGEKNT